MANLTDCPAGDTNQICGLLSGLGVGTGNFLTAITPSTISLIGILLVIGAVAVLITGLAIAIKNAFTKSGRITMK